MWVSLLLEVKVGREVDLLLELGKEGTFKLYSLPPVAVDELCSLEFGILFASVRKMDGKLPPEDTFI